jgi:glycosyltransferase involved in cell wall biosynthesis
VLLRALVERGHRVTAFAACSKPAEIDQARKLFPAPEYDLRLYPFPAPSLRNKIRNFFQPYGYMFGSELRRDLDTVLAQGFDILHLEQLWSGWLGLRYPGKALLNVHHLVWIDLSESPVANRRQARDFERQFVAERRLIRKYRHIRSCSPRLVEPMLAENLGAEITVVPVGIDASLYEYIPDEKRVSNALIGLIGTMGWYPGYSAAVRLLTRLRPAIKQRVPEAKVRIIGWSARSALAEFLELPDVEIIENVPDTRPYFESTNVLLYAPSRGSGMKIKILEAMGYGVPIVTTSEGVEGIPALDGVHVGLCEDDAGLIDRTVELLRDPARQNDRRRAARSLLESHCAPAATVDAIEEIYRKMLESHR